MRFVFNYTFVDMCCYSQCFKGSVLISYTQIAIIVYQKALLSLFSEDLECLKVRIIYSHESKQDPKLHLIISVEFGRL